MLYVVSVDVSEAAILSEDFGDGGGRAAFASRVVQAASLAALDRGVSDGYAILHGHSVAVPPCCDRSRLIACAPPQLAQPGPACNIVRAVRAALLVARRHASARLVVLICSPTAFSEQDRQQVLNAFEGAPARAIDLVLVGGEELLQDAGSLYNLQQLVNQLNVLAQRPAASSSSGGNSSNTAALRQQPNDAPRSSNGAFAAAAVCGSAGASGAQPSASASSSCQSSYTGLSASASSGRHIGRSASIRHLVSSGAFTARGDADAEGDAYGSSGGSSGHWDFLAPSRLILLPAPADALEDAQQSCQWQTQELLLELLELPVLGAAPPAEPDALEGKGEGSSEGAAEWAARASAPRQEVSTEEKGRLGRPVVFSCPPTSMCLCAHASACAVPAWMHLNCTHHIALRPPMQALVGAAPSRRHVAASAHDPPCASTSGGGSGITSSSGGGHQAMHGHSSHYSSHSGTGAAPGSARSRTSWRQPVRTTPLAGRALRPSVCRFDSLDSLQHLSCDGLSHPWLPSYATLGKVSEWAEGGMVCVAAAAGLCAVQTVGLVAGCMDGQAVRTQLPWCPPARRCTATSRAAPPHPLLAATPCTQPLPQKAQLQDRFCPVAAAKVVFPHWYTLIRVRAGRVAICEGSAVSGSGTPLRLVPQAGLGWLSLIRAVDGSNAMRLVWHPAASECAGGADSNADSTPAGDSPFHVPAAVLPYMFNAGAGTVRLLNAVSGAAANLQLVPGAFVRFMEVTDSSGVGNDCGGDSAAGSAIAVPAVSEGAAPGTHVAAAAAAAAEPGDIQEAGAGAGEGEQAAASPPPTSPPSRVLLVEMFAAPAPAAAKPSASASTAEAQPASPVIRLAFWLPPPAAGTALEEHAAAGEGGACTGAAAADATCVANALRQLLTAPPEYNPTSVMPGEAAAMGRPVLLGFIPRSLVGDLVRMDGRAVSYLPAQASGKIALYQRGTGGGGSGSGIGGGAGSFGNSGGSLRSHALSSLRPAGGAAASAGSSDGIAPAQIGAALIIDLGDQPLDLSSGYTTTSSGSLFGADAPPAAGAQGGAAPGQAAGTASSALAALHERGMRQAWLDQGMERMRAAQQRLQRLSDGHSGGGNGHARSRLHPSVYAPLKRGGRRQSCCGEPAALAPLASHPLPDAPHSYPLLAVGSSDDDDDCQRKGRGVRIGEPVAAGSSDAGCLGGGCSGTSSTTLGLLPCEHLPDVLREEPRRLPEAAAVSLSSEHVAAVAGKPLAVPLGGAGWGCGVNGSAAVAAAAAAGGVEGDDARQLHDQFDLSAHVAAVHGDDGEEHGAHGGGGEGARRLAGGASPLVTPHAPSDVDDSHLFELD